MTTESPLAAKRYATQTGGHRPIRIPLPTKREITRAQAEFRRIEKRDLFYRAARELIRLQGAGLTSITLPEALAVLLQTWNKAYYRYRAFDFDALDALWSRMQTRLAPFRERTIQSYCEADEGEVEAIFEAFAAVLGPVGAAKSLHLLAPRFFPIWDDRIARAYFVNSNAQSRPADYATFMLICQHQAKVAKLDPETALKSLDEFNYVVYTLSALARPRA